MTYKSAWFMSHRIRYAMKQPPLQQKMRGTVEVDETFIGGKERGVGSGNYRTANSNKVPVVALVERGRGVRSFPMERVTMNNIIPLLKEHVDHRAHVNTDDAKVYARLGPRFP